MFKLTTKIIIRTFHGKIWHSQKSKNIINIKNERNYSSRTPANPYPNISNSFLFQSDYEICLKIILDINPAIPVSLPLFQNIETLMTFISKMMTLLKSGLSSVE